MEATHTRRLHGGLGRFAATRRGAITIAAVAAALAGIVLLAFISQYKNHVQGGTAERSALVANRLIPKGTAGAVVVGGGLFKPATVQAGQPRVRCAVERRRARRQGRDTRHLSGPADHRGGLRLGRGSASRQASWRPARHRRATGLGARHDRRGPRRRRGGRARGLQLRGRDRRPRPPAAPHADPGRPGPQGAGRRQQDDKRQRHEEHDCAGDGRPGRAARVRRGQRQGLVRPAPAGRRQDASDPLRSRSSRSWPARRRSRWDDECPDPRPRRRRPDHRSARDRGGSGRPGHRCGRRHPAGGRRSRRSRHARGRAPRGVRQGI